MTDLTEFLLTRIADDEVAARVAVGPGRGLALAINPARGTLEISPARLLADCDAKRRIVGLHRLYDGKAYRQTLCCARCTAYGEYPADDEYSDEQNWPCPTLRALALPYADHPDYLDEWRP